MFIILKKKTLFDDVSKPLQLLTKLTWSEERGLHLWIFSGQNKLNKETPVSFLWLNKQSEFKGQHNFILFTFYFVYICRTLPPFYLQTVSWESYFFFTDDGYYNVSFKHYLLFMEFVDKNK